MIRGSGDPTNGNERWLGSQSLVGFRRSLSSDDLEDILVDGGVVLLDSKISDVLWPVRGRVG